MEWQRQEHTDRKGLVGQLRQDLDKSATRGNFIWSVKNRELFLYEIEKQNNIWHYRIIKEKDFDKTQLSCPVSYLNKTECTNKPWRELLLEYNQRKRQIKHNIDEAFKQAQESGKQLIVYTDSKEVPKVVIESIVPLEGRYNNSKLYKIPFGRITKWEIQ